jgi:hypothetical protein
LTTAILEERVGVLTSARTLINQALTVVRDGSSSLSRSQSSDYTRRLLALRKELDAEIAGYKKVLATIAPKETPNV